jgi:hypothetical protein
MPQPARPSPQPGIGYPNNELSIAAGVTVYRAVTRVAPRNRQVIGDAQRLTVQSGAGPGGLFPPRRVVDQWRAAGGPSPGRDT